MVPLIVLIATYVVARFVLRRRGEASLPARVALGAMLATTGVAHFTSTEALVAMVPPVVPAAELVVYATGVAEVGFAVLLVVRPSPALGWILAVFFLALLPANIHSAVSEVGMAGYGPAYLWFRVPLQLLFIAWALWSTGARVMTTRGIGFPRLYDLLLRVLTRGRERAYREDVVRLAGIRPGLDVLDVGCGTGTLAIAAWHAAQPGGGVSGTDVSPPMLAAARRKAHRAGADVRFQLGEAASLPFEEGRFDVVTMTTVMHAVPEGQRSRCLDELRRVLKPGGRLVLVDFGGDVAQRRAWSARHGAHGAFDLHDLRELLFERGFDHVDGGTLAWMSLHYLCVTRGS